MNYPTLVAVVNDRGNVDIKTIKGSRTPLKQMNCEGKALVVTQLIQENGSVVEVYVQCNDGLIRVYDRSGSCIRTR